MKSSGFYVFPVHTRNTFLNNRCIPLWCMSTWPPGTKPLLHEQWTSPTRFQHCRWPQQVLSFITDPPCNHSFSFSHFRARLFHNSLRDVKAWVADLRLWTRSRCPPAKELSRGLQPKSRHMPQLPQQTLSCFSELQFPPATKFNPKTSTNTLLLWVTCWLTAGPRQSLMNSASCCAFYEKLTASILPLPASATNTCARSTNTNTKF